MLVTGGADACIKIWTLPSLHLLHTFQNHTGIIQTFLQVLATFTAQVPSLPSTDFLSVGLDGVVGHFNSHAGTCLHTFSGHSTTISDIRISFTQGTVRLTGQAPC